MRIILNEGVIDVPENLQKQAYEIVKLASYQAVYDVYKSTPLFLDYLHIKLSENIKNLSSDFSMDEIEGNRVLLFDLIYNHSEIKYSDQKGIDGIQFGLANINKTLSGAYDSNNDMVIINFHSLLEALGSTRDIYAGMYEKNDLSRNELFEELELFDFHQTVESHVRKFLSETKSTIEHELAHYIQYHFLKQKSEKQVGQPNYKHEEGSKENYDEYFGSEVEYSPQIISSVRDFESFFQNLNDKAHEYIDEQYVRHIFDFMVGISKNFNTVGEHTGQNLRGIDNTLTLGRFIKPSRNFFLSIKNTDKEKWKKAVKYFWNELQKRELI